VTFILLSAADVYAPEPLGLRNLLLGGGRILAISAEPLELPAAIRRDCRHLDLDGRPLIPGLVDAHVHVTGGGGESGFDSRVPPIPLSRFTSTGITTVVGLLGTDDVARGPRELLATIYALRAAGLIAFGYTGGYHLPPATLTGSVRSDLVFIDALIGIGEVAISDHRSSQPTLDEILRLASDTHVAGMMTGKAGVLHLHLGDGPRGLALVREALAQTELPCRVFHPTHVNRRRALFDEAVDLARAGCTIDITAFPVGADEDAWSAAAALARYLDQGAPPDRVTVSSDAGGCLPCFDADGRVSRMDIGSSGALLETIAGLVAGGMSLATVLPAFTSNPARLLRLARKGIIAVDADADLVVLDASGRASSVIMGGELAVHEGAALKRGLFETESLSGFAIQRG
jgi:beta-aspartyl-dipeptidase (metallo-type)